MKIHNKCLECFQKQAVDACKRVGIEGERKASVMAKIEEMRESFSPQCPPVEFASDLYELIEDVSGVKDVFKSVKEEGNRICSEIYNEIYHYLDNSNNRMETAVKLAIAGNIIDYGAISKRKTSFKKESLLQVVEQTLKDPIMGSALNNFEEMVRSAKKILYIGDNAGECFFDSILLDVLPIEKITYAVRGKPILNDATMVDAEAAGIHKKCKIIDTGDNTPGVILDRASDEFVKIFNECDMFIAKGQGNYESLGDIEWKNRALVFRVKCDVVAEDTGHPFGSSVLLVRERMK